MPSKTRPNRRRRARAWAEKYGKADPLYVACPACSSAEKMACRGTREAFHPERIAAAARVDDLRPTRPTSAIATVNLDALDRRPYRHVERSDSR